MRWISLLVLLMALGAGAAPTSEALLKAVRAGDVGLVRELLTRHPDQLESREPRFGSVPLHAAVAANQPEVVKLLLQRGANVNARNDLGITPLHLCAQFNRVDLARTLLDHRANPNALTNTHITPLRLAQANRNHAVAALIRSRGGHE